MTTFHITNRPVSGTAISRPATTSAATQQTARIARHVVRLSRARDLRVVGERDRGHQPVHPAIWSLALRKRAGEDRADVGEHRAAEVRPPRAERQEGLVAEAQDFGVAGRGDRDRARAAVEERDLPERAHGSDRAAGGVQAAVDEQVERAVALALLQDVLAGAEDPRLGVFEQERPVLVALTLEEAGRVVGGETLCAGILEEAAGVHHGWIRVIVWSAWLATQTAPAPLAMPSGLLAHGDRRADDAAGGRVEAGDAVVVVVGDPHEAVAEGQLAGVGADLGRAEHGAGLAVQAGDGAVAGVRDPCRLGGLDHAAGLVADRDRRADDLGGRRVDAGDGVVAVVGHPHEAAADEDAARLGADADRARRRSPARRGRSG